MDTALRGHIGSSSWLRCGGSHPKAGPDSRRPGAAAIQGPDPAPLSERRPKPQALPASTDSTPVSAHSIASAPFERFARGASSIRGFIISAKRAAASRSAGCSDDARARCSASGHSRRGRGPTPCPEGSREDSERRRSGLLRPAARELCAVSGDCCRSLGHSCLQFVSLAISLANGGIF